MPERNPHHFGTEEGGIKLAMLFQTNPNFAKKIMQASRKDQINRVFDPQPDKSKINKSTL